MACQPTANPPNPGDYETPALFQAAYVKWMSEEADAWRASMGNTEPMIGPTSRDPNPSNPAINAQGEKPVDLFTAEARQRAANGYVAAQGAQAEMNEEAGQP